MSDTPIDTGATGSVASNPVAPPSGGDTQGSTPASVVTTAPAQDEPAGDEPSRQSRREARAYASQRRQIGELQREIGGLREQIRSSPRGQAPEGDPPPRGELSEVERLRQEFNYRETERVSRSFWAGAEKEAKDKGIAGFAEAREVLRSGEIATNPVMSHYVTDMADNKAALVVWLADNPEEAERIANLNPLAAGAALARQDARLSAKPAARTSNAPPPVPTVGGRSTASFDPKTASMDEYAADWKRRQAKR